MCRLSLSFLPGSSNNPHFIQEKKDISCGTISALSQEVLTPKCFYNEGNYYFIEQEMELWQFQDSLRPSGHRRSYCTSPGLTKTGLHPGEDGVLLSSSLLLSQK